jgi:outer membrane protein OmpA-like peptidoglycan-associated protein
MRHIPALPAFLLAVPLGIVTSLTACSSPAPGNTTSVATSGPTSTAPTGLEQPWWQAPDKPDKPDKTPIHQTFSMSGDVLFEGDRADLTPAAASQLTTILDVVHAHPGAHVLVEGHADKGNGGSPVIAKVLSEQRALVGGEWFLARGLTTDQVQTMGYGDIRPKAPSDTPEHRAQNRRCDITVTSG